MKYCQSCAQPLDDDLVMGTEADGTLNGDYCIHCFRDGAFVNPHMTLEEMKQRVKAEMTRHDLGQHFIELTVHSLPFFRRWRQSAVVM